MNTTDKVRYIIYRCHEKGLEVFLINPELDKDKDLWRLPSGYLESSKLANGIELDGLRDHNGQDIKTIAVEADWHQIPSIRGIIKHDVKRLKSKIKKISGLEGCNYLHVKDALKQVMPQEYKVLKELKDIIVDRNMVSVI